MNRGFTLIELAIVIVIAAILAAVAIPIYNGIIDDAKWSEAESTVGTIQAALKVEMAKKSDATFSFADYHTSGAIDYTTLNMQSPDGQYFIAAAYTLADTGNLAANPAEATNPNPPSGATKTATFSGTASAPKWSTLQ